MPRAVRLASVSAKADSVARSTSRVGVAVVVMVLVAAWHAGVGGTASAATVSVSGHALTFTAAPGETNDVQLELWNAGAPNEFVAVHERGAVLVLGSGCTPIGADGLPVPPAGAQRANCGAVTSATVSLGDMGDSAWMGTRRSAQDPNVQVILSGGDGDDFLLGGPLSDQLNGGAGNDVLDGWEGADTLTGGLGSDSFYMGECSGSPCAPATSADAVVGGDGVDIATYHRDSNVAVTLDGIANDGGPGEGDNVATDVENLVGGWGEDMLTGTAAANDIDGGAGAGDGPTGDVLNGLGGNDTLHTNNPFRSTLNGGGGNDHLYSARTLNGGDGDDMLVRHSGGVAVPAMLTGGNGTDTASYGGWAEYEPVTITLDGVANDGTLGLGDNVNSDVENVIGGRGSDVLIGNDAANRFDGGPGGDTFAGGQGSDTIDYSGRGPLAIEGSPVTVSLDGVADDGAAYGPYPGGGPEGDNIQPDVENVHGTPGADTLTGSAADNHLQGAAGADTLVGGPGADMLAGESGDDRLQGGLGADDLAGGEGIDTADYAERSADVDIALDGLPTSGNADDGSVGARDTVESDVENIQGGSGDDTLTGNALMNRLDGGLGDDELLGLAGIDTADYSARAVTVVVDLGDAEPSDGALDEADSVGADVENVVGGSGADVLIGSSAANVLEGRGGDDELDGGDGPDALHGGDGFDSASYDGRAASVAADLDGAAGDDGEVGEGDTLPTDLEALIGGNGNDVLTGNASDNVLDGGPGGDQLNGGPGYDAADYTSRTSSVTADPDGVGGDDGEIGEGDSVATDVEDLYGGAGDDTLSGDSAGNVLFGGAGADRLDGGAGEDALFGEGGGDELIARDADADLASCGPGDDLVRPDALDELLDCERRDDAAAPAPTITPTPLATIAPPATTARPADTAAPRVRVTVPRQRLARVRRSGLRVQVSCSEPCTFTARLQVDARTAKRLRLGRRVLGEARGRIATRAKTLVVRLNAGAKKTLSRRRSLQATVVVSATDTAGNRRDARVRVSLRAA